MNQRSYKDSAERTRTVVRHVLAGILAVLDVHFCLIIEN